MTILLISICAESLSRQIWPEQVDDPCIYHSKLLGERHRANCVMQLKNVEGPWVRYQTNACGYRGTAFCGPKQAGTMRIVILGTSAAFGLYVPSDEFFADRAAPELSRIWGRPVEFENLGDIGFDWSRNDALLNEVRSLTPDAVFLVLTPFDLNRMDTLQAYRTKQTGLPVEQKPIWTWTDMRLFVRQSRACYMAQHFLLRDQSFFFRSFARYADPFDVSRVPSPPLVQERVARMDMMVKRLTGALDDAHVPSYMLALPNRIEAGLISANVAVPGMDAYAFPKRMREVAERHGMNYIDLVPDVRATPKSEELFYAVDGHANAGANALMSRAIVRYFSQCGSLCPKSLGGGAAFEAVSATSPAKY
jgi:hypothetical protein